MKVQIATVLLFCSASMTSFASTAAPFWAGGVGTSTCGDFVAAMRLSGPDMGSVEPTGRFFSEATVYLEWALGFLSRRNMDEGSMHHYSRGTVSTWLNNYCQTHATELFLSAVSRLAKEP